MTLRITQEMGRGDAVSRGGAEVWTEILHLNYAVSRGEASVWTEILHLNSPPGCSSTEFEHPESALS